MNWAEKVNLSVPLAPPAPHPSSTFCFTDTGTCIAQLTGETLPRVRWRTVRRLIQQSKTVEPNNTCQHRFISTGQTRPPLFLRRMYISNANFNPSCDTNFPPPWTCPFFIVSPAAPMCGRDRRSREWAAGRERRRREGRCCCWHGAALRSRRPGNTGRRGLERINIMFPHNCTYARAGAARCSDCEPGSGGLGPHGEDAAFSWQ